MLQAPHYYAPHLMYAMRLNRVLPSLNDACIGGDTSGTNVSKSKRPVLDWAFSSQYRFSKSIMSDSST